jgi:ParB-like chromosome segregation protein Spo0J
MIAKPAIPHPMLSIAGVDYVVVPSTEYLDLIGRASAGARLPEAKALVIAEMGRRVRAARAEAGLSQAELAQRMGMSQARVSRAESGLVSLSAAFLARVHKACGLDVDWIPAEGRRA